MNHRTLASSAAALVLMAASAAGEPDRHGKTIQQCTAEMEAGKAALAAAGESASTFIHDCWWHTKAGQRTPIAGLRPATTDDAAAKLGKADAAVAKAQAEAAAAKEEAARAKQDAAEARKAVEAQSAKMSTKAAASPVVAKPPSKVAAAKTTPEPTRTPHPIRVAAPAIRLHRPVAHRPFTPWAYAPPPPALAMPRREPARLAEVRVAPIARRPRADAPPPLVEMVPVHIAGVPRTVRWPVFPDFVPTFRDAVNHPIVPGFTSTP